MKKIRTLFILCLGSISAFAQGLSGMALENLNLDDINPAGQLVIGDGYNMANSPFGNTDWWNVVSMRHRNPANHFATQIAGNFYGNRLAFRNTQNASNQPWNEIYHSGNIGALNTGIGFNGSNNLGLKWERTGDLASLYYSNTENGYGKLMLDVGDDNIPSQGFQIRGVKYTGDINEIAYFGANGNVGIGTATPQEKLSVNGKIRAKEIKVEASNWPDYVFEPEHKPLSLEETEAYIKAHRHLPEVPSAKEVEANGVSLGEMNKLLLKKIEELTLQMIEKNKLEQHMLLRIKKLELNIKTFNRRK